MRSRVPALLLAALVGTLAPARAQWTEKAYAPVKQLTCRSCSDLLSPVPLPARGFIFADGALFSESSTWMIADFDAHTLAEVIVMSNSAGRKTGETVTRRRDLSRGQEIRLVDKANAIWSADERMPSRKVNHPYWNLELYDGGEMRKEGGAGVPEGKASELAALLKEIMEAPER